MRKYEIMFIVKPTLDEEAIKNVTTEVEKLFKANKVEIIEQKDMGQKELAYEIDKHTRGYYFFYVIKADANAISEFNRIANVNEDIIRTSIIKIEG